MSRDTEPVPEPTKRPPSPSVLAGRAHEKILKLRAECAVKVAEYPKHIVERYEAKVEALRGAQDEETTVYLDRLLAE